MRHHLPMHGVPASAVPSCALGRMRMLLGRLSLACCHSMPGLRCISMPGLRGRQRISYLFASDTVPLLCCAVRSAGCKLMTAGVFFSPLKSCAFGSSGGWQPRQVYFCQFIFSLMLLALLLTLAAALESNGVGWCNTASPRLCVGSLLQGIYLACPRCAHVGGYGC